MRRVLELLVVALSGTLALSACGDSDSDSGNNSGGVATASVADAQAAFCSEAEGTIEVLDEYSTLLVSPSATVEDLRDTGDEVTANRTATAAAANDLKTAIDRAAAPTTTEVGATTAEPESTTTVPEIVVSDESITRLEDADEAFDKALENVDDNTPINEASVELTSTAFQLGVAWLRVFDEAGCLEDTDAAYEKVATYTSALQTDLTDLGFFKGAIDGIYGPETVAAVKAFQKSAGLPETGLTDPATQQAMGTDLAAKKSASIASLQTILKAGGFYTGPVDGVWSPAVEGAVKAFQKEADLPETGTVDAATLAALLLGVEQVTSPSTTTVASTTTTGASTTTAPTSTTAAATTTTSATSG